MLHFIVFWLYINIETISLAFTRWDIYENKYIFVGLENFKEQFRMFKEKPDTLNMFINSFRAIPINIACLLLALIIGYAFSKHIRGEKVFRTIFYLPSMISIVIQTLCFRYMFTYHADGTFVGPGAALFRMLGIDYLGWATNEPAAAKMIWGLITFFCIWASAGINIILMASAMSRIPEEVIESAKLDGVGFWRELFQITIPLIMPTISVFLVNSMMAVSAFYLQPMLITDGAFTSTYNTVGWYMFDSAPKASNGKLPEISTIGFILTVAVTFLVILVKKITDKITPDVDF